MVKTNSNVLRLARDKPNLCKLTILQFYNCSSFILLKEISLLKKLKMLKVYSIMFERCRDKKIWVCDKDWIPLVPGLRQKAEKPKSKLMTWAPNFLQLLHKLKIQKVHFLQNFFYPIPRWEEHCLYNCRFGLVCWGHQLGSAGRPFFFKQFTIL